MRLHTSATEDQVRVAARAAGVDLVGFTRHGSRSHAYAFEVKLEGSSRRRPNGGSSHRLTGEGTGYAATWDQWGIFLGALYDVDPEMKAGWAYANQADFDYKTGTRFAEGAPADMHGDHKWESLGYGAQGCRKCMAVNRWLA